MLFTGGAYAAFLLFGLTDDRFSLPDTRLVDLPDYLELNLRTAGLRLAFHHPAHGVRITDTLADRNGLSNRSAARQQSRTRPPASKSRTFTRVNEIDLPSIIRGFFEGGERDQPQAFIFEDLQHFANLDPRAAPAFWAELRDVVRSADGNIIIFISNSRTISSLLRYGPDFNFLYSFVDEFRREDGSLRPNVVRIGAPGADEIRNVQRRYRLRDQVPTNFISLAARCERIAAELRAKTDLSESALRYNERRLREHDWITHANAEPALDRLAALPGRESVAKKVRDDISYFSYRLSQGRQNGNYRRNVAPFEVERLSDRPQIENPPEVNLSYALTGNPGTGKSTIARLMAVAMQEAGILRSGHCIEVDIQDMVAGYVGQTALKASDLLSRARGGVLFLDEVQKFDKDNQFHREAIGTILKYVEDHRGDISVIVATYPHSMDDFLQIDEGLPRRFSQRIDLDDYDAATCTRIFEHIATEREIAVSPDLSGKLDSFFDAWINDRTQTAPFSNAGSVRNLIEEMDRNRVTSGAHEMPLSVEHVPEQFAAYMKAAVTREVLTPEERLEDAVKKLQALPGLETVKNRIQLIVTTIKAQKIRGEQNDITPGHYSFEGSPGTGKTTVARLLGDIFRELGVLRSGHVVEVARSGLVGRYQGHTAVLVQEVAETAMDGVLFIDEAHNLIQGEHDNFGMEAIGALTAILENHRQRLCVIAAGYGAPMERLFDVDQGWRSRFSARLQFEDYEPGDMAKILRLMCAQRKRTLDPDLEGELEALLGRLRVLQGAGFANGRSVRNLLGAMESQLDKRLVAARHSTDPYKLTLDDVPRELRGQSRSP